MIAGCRARANDVSEWRNENGEIWLELERDGVAAESSVRVEAGGPGMEVDVPEWRREAHVAVPPECLLHVVVVVCESDRVDVCECASEPPSVDGAGRRRDVDVVRGKRRALQHGGKTTDENVLHTVCPEGAQYRKRLEGPLMPLPVARAAHVRPSRRRRLAHQCVAPRGLCHVRQIDSGLEPLKGMQGEPAKDIARIRSIQGCQPARLVYLLWYEYCDLAT